MLITFIEGDVEMLRLLVLKIICHFGCKEIKDAHNAVKEMSNLVKRSKFNFKNLKRMEPNIDVNVLNLLEYFTGWNKENCQSVEMIAKCAIRIVYACHEESIMLEKLVRIADRIYKFSEQYPKTTNLVDLIFYKTSRISLLLKKVISKLQRVQNVGFEEKCIVVATTFLHYGKMLNEENKYEKAIIPFENAIALLKTASSTERHDKLLAEVYRELGKAHWNCSRIFEAQQAFQKSKKICPYSNCDLTACEILKSRALTWLGCFFTAFSKSLLLLLVIIGVLLAFVVFSDPNLISFDSVSVKLIILTRISNFLFYLNDFVNEAAEDVRANLDL